MASNIKFIFFSLLFSTHAFPLLLAQSQNYNRNDISKNDSIWISDNGDGTYKNPIIYADYSDPDVIRVGDDFYMTASSFSHFPGLPILHSKDLVNWKILAHAVINYPIDDFNKPQHGGGIWAPSLRYHKGEFYIYFGDPDFGIFVTKSKNAEGPWEPLKLIQNAKGWIDPCPFWDDDGNAFLIRAWARSRSGIKHKLTLHKMSSDGTKLLDEGKEIFCDSLKHPTMEGPKIYKRNGYYYIFAPAGGVKPGWQTVLRSKNIYGPYEDKIVLEQGSTKINGPHQGGWVQTQTGEDWFIHFQDRYAYGRVVHLQPMKWTNDWPVMGKDYDGNGIGEPVLSFLKPNVGKTFSMETPQTSDEFDSLKLGLQWQWQANFSDEWISLKERKGWLRFYSQPFSAEEKNLWNAPFLLLQKFPAQKFRATIKLNFNSKTIGEKTGLIIFGLDYAYLGIENTGNGLKIIYSVCKDASKGNSEIVENKFYTNESEFYFRVVVYPENEEEIIPKVLCSFSYSADGKNFVKAGNDFVAREGKWVGAKVGLFSFTNEKKTTRGFADFDWVNFENFSLN